MAMCEKCGKTKRAGNNVSHSNVHTKRLFRPNIQKATVLVDGRLKQQKLCTRCIRTLAKSPRGMK
jgi:large subunit ribosomal protein L28